MKKATYIFLSLVSMTFLFNSCKKESFPEPKLDFPKLYLEGDISGKNSKVTAGSGLSFSKCLGYDIIDLSSQDTFRFFSFSLYEVDSDSIITKEINVTMNNCDKKVSTMESDLSCSINPGQYRFAYSSVPNTLFFYPNEIRVYYRVYDPFMHTTFYYETLPCQYNGNNNLTFHIKNVSPYEFEGKKYMMAEVEFSCWLYCYATNKYIKFDKMKGRIAFGLE